MRKILRYKLQILTKRVIARYQPIIIGITGSVGKTTTKEAIYAVLHRNFFVRKSEANNNNEFGVFLTVLGIPPTFMGLVQGIKLALGPRVLYPKILVLELGADRPGDILYLADLLKPQIAVVTAVGKMPVHVEFYASPEAVAKEKAHILDHVGKQGLAVLNLDDDIVAGMKEKVKGQTMTYGFNNHADIWVSDLAYYLDTAQTSIAGLSFKMHKGETFVPVRLAGLVGAHQIHALLAATAVGIRFGMNLVEIISSFENIELPQHRMNLLKGINGSTIIDDTYNASPLSTQAAIETLRDLGTTFTKIDRPSRKIAVLGDMKELGEYATEAHKKMYQLAQRNADRVLVIGELWPPNEAMSKDEVIKKLKELIHPGDIVLIKGSRAMKMEEIVSALKG